MAVDQRYVFNVEWYDQAASLVRTYILTYYPSDKTLDMVRPTERNRSTT